MKPIASSVLISVVVLLGLALASESGERKERPSMPMTQEMMKDGKDGEHKGGMMRMMKMMDQCAAMMESADDSKAKESQKQ
jgi:hypothetical protein